uniref:Uncharacterized protein n=1 Tax=Arundo donax TaxID=35708 RepID=A0A0A8YAA3_ARUDO
MDTAGIRISEVSAKKEKEKNRILRPIRTGPIIPIRPTVVGPLTGPIMPLNPG